MGCGARDAPQPTRKFGGLEVWLLSGGALPHALQGALPLDPGREHGSLHPGARLRLALSAVEPGRVAVCGATGWA